jgi:hypothetical protein
MAYFLPAGELLRFNGLQKRVVRCDRAQSFHQSS